MVIHNVEVAATAYAVTEINCQLIFSPCVNSPLISFVNVVQSHRLHVAYCMKCLGVVDMASCSQTLLTHARRTITLLMFFYFSSGTLC